MMHYTGCKETVKSCKYSFDEKKISTIFAA